MWHYVFVCQFDTHLSLVTVASFAVFKNVLLPHMHLRLRPCIRVSFSTAALLFLKNKQKKNPSEYLRATPSPPFSLFILCVLPHVKSYARVKAGGWSGSGVGEEGSVLFCTHLHLIVSPVRQHFLGVISSNTLANFRDIGP